MNKDNISSFVDMSRGFLQKKHKISSEEERRLSCRDHELALDIALHDAGVLLRVNLAEDASIEGLLRRLAVGRCPERTSGPDAGTSLISKKKTSLTSCSRTVRSLPVFFRQRAVQFGFCVSGETFGAVISFRRVLQAPASPGPPPERRPSDITRRPSSYLS